MKNFGSCEGDPWFEPFREWGGHRTKGQICSKACGRKSVSGVAVLAWHREPRLGIREVSPAEHLTTELGLNRALSSLRCRKGAERRQNVTDLCVWLFCTSSCKHCLFFPYIPAWNHTLVVCFVISFGAERRQENFLLDGLKGSVLYTTWVTRTMSDQSAVKWKKVTAQSEWDEFSHSAVARGRHGLALPGSSHRWLGQNNWDRDENTQPFLLNLAGALLLGLVSSYQGNQKTPSGQGVGKGGAWNQLCTSISCSHHFLQCLCAMCNINSCC